jgi:acetyl-CoA carboxylase carboxyltransferase component
MPLDAKLLQGFKDRRKKIYAAGGEDKIKQRHEKGLLSARERLMALYQPDTFQEIGAFVKHTCTHFGMDKKDLAADGVIVGTGFVDGRQVSAFSQDFTVVGGTLGKLHAR